MKRTVVLFVHGPPVFGGDSAVVLHTVEHLSERFRRIVVLPPGSTAWERFSGVEHQSDTRLVPIETGAVDHLTTNGRAGRSKVGTVMLLAGAFVRLLGLTIRERVDVVYTLDRSRAVPIAVLAARLLKRGLVFHAQSSWTGWKRAALASDRVIAISNYVRDEYVRNGVPADRIDVVHNGIAVGHFTSGDPTEARMRLGVPAGSPLVVLPGRLSRFKGQLELVEAIPSILSAFPATHFALAGSDTSEIGDLASGGGMRSVLIERATALGVADRTHFLTSTEQEMANLYAAADIVVVPSWEEPFGLVVVEAMAAGKPVVGSNTGAIPEIVVDGESGLLVPPRHSAALAEGIVRLLADPELSRRLGSAGQARARRLFSIERYARDFEAVVDSVMRARGARPRGWARAD